jgi:uncharacterized protein
MEKSIKITLIISITILILGLTGLSVLTSIINPNAETITVRGEASVEAIPDLVTVYFNVETKELTSVLAKDKNAEIIEAVKEALTQADFEDDEIQTLNFNIRENYDWKNNQRIFLGYMATHQIKLELPTSKSEKIGTAIDAGVNAGAQINYINFELSQDLQNQYKAQAMKLAAQDARIKAESTAEGFDKNLGKLISTSVDNFGYQPWRTFSSSGMDIEEDAASAKVASTDIAPSEQTIHASVNAIYKIK